MERDPLGPPYVPTKLNIRLAQIGWLDKDSTPDFLLIGEQSF